MKKQKKKEFWKERRDLVVDVLNKCNTSEEFTNVLRKIALNVAISNFKEITKYMDGNKFDTI